MRPIILGMTNPRPGEALAPGVVGSAGWRLWRMVEAACGMTREDYLATFDRRNLITGTWRRRRTSDTGARFVADLPAGSTVVVLGRDVWEMLGFSPATPGAEVAAAGSTFIFLPHPSGRNLHYNDALNRWRAGETLAALARRHKCAA